MFPTEVKERLLELSPREPRIFVQRTVHDADHNIFAGHQVGGHDVPRYYLQLVDWRVHLAPVLFDKIAAAVAEDAAELLPKFAIVGHDALEVFAAQNNLGCLAL